MLNSHLEFCRTRESRLCIRRESFIICDTHRQTCTGKCVSHDRLILSSAQDKPDGRHMVRRVPELTVNDCDVHTQLTQVFSTKTPDLQLDNDIPTLRNVEQQQIQHDIFAVSVLVGDRDPDLSSDERHSTSKLHEGVLDAIDQHLLDVSFRRTLALLTFPWVVTAVPWAGSCGFRC